MTGLLLIQAAATLGYALSRVGELRIHAKNLAALRAAGAAERAPIWALVYIWAGWLVLPVAWVECLVGSGPDRDQAMLGMMLLAGSLGLRVWAIQSLGPLWSMRCLWLDGARPLNRGPYKYLDHPEYWTRIADAVGLGLMLGAPWTAVGAVVGTGFLALRLAREELISREAFGRVAAFTQPGDE